MGSSIGFAVFLSCEKSVPFRSWVCKIRSILQVSRKSKLFLAISMLLLVGVVGGWQVNQRLMERKQQREAHMVALYFLALVSDENTPGTYASNLDGVLREFGVAGYTLLKPFPDTPLYQGNGQSFTLAEAKPRRISLFRSDRLIATESKWPRWERSGEYARKFPEQEIPEPMK